jgi:hypothetical protein
VTSAPSNAPSSTSPGARPQKLAIIHLLGWMVGVGAVLAIYRLGDALIGFAGQRTLFDQLIQLGFGLTYGTAISGLALFVWRWRRGTGSLPTQPGHWLLVFGGLGLLIDVGVAFVVNVGPMLFGYKYAGLDYWSWYLHQLIGWSIAALIAALVVANLRAARWWHIVSWVVLAMALANAAAMVTELLGVQGILRGNWTYDVALAVRLVGEACCVIAITAAEISDRRRGLPRDWLHLGGICTALGLAVVDLSVQGYFAWLRWQ